MSDRPVAFVIMPFDAELNEVYSAFIVPTLEEVGYSVLRADDLYGQRNILRDIVESISNSELIVADLTGLNPNVFYELGVAHALQRPVILMTQNIDELPFDLQSYRVVIYETHFARIERAREALKQTALGALQGQIEFGNPVSDFASAAGRQVSRSPSTAAGRPSTTAEDDADEEAGWLDHRVAMEEGFDKLTGILDSVTESTSSIGEKAQQYSERFARANATQGTGAASTFRYIANEYGRELVQYGESLSAANDSYERVARETENSIEFIISHAKVSSEEDFQSLFKFVETLEGVEAAASGAITAYVGMRETVRSLEGAERSMTRAARVVGRELDRFVGNIEKTIASVQRGVEIGRRKIEAAAEERSKHLDSAEFEGADVSPNSAPNPEPTDAEGAA